MFSSLDDSNRNGILLWFRDFFLSVLHIRTSYGPVGVNELMFQFRLLPFVDSLNIPMEGSGQHPWRTWHAEAVGCSSAQDPSVCFSPSGPAQPAQLAAEQGTCFPSSPVLVKFSRLPFLLRSSPCVFSGLKLSATSLPFPLSQSPLSYPFLFSPSRGLCSPVTDLYLRITPLHI